MTKKQKFFKSISPYHKIWYNKDPSMKLLMKKKEKHAQNVAAPKSSTKKAKYIVKSVGL